MIPKVKRREVTSDGNNEHCASAVEVAISIPPRAPFESRALLNCALRLYFAPCDERAISCREARVSAASNSSNPIVTGSSRFS